MVRIRIEFNDGSIVEHFGDESDERDVELASLRTMIDGMAPPPSYIDPYYFTEHWIRLRNKVIARDKGVCFYCGKPGNQADHVKPRKRGGKDHVDNLVCACHRCNALFGNKVFKGGRFGKRKWLQQMIAPP